MRDLLVSAAWAAAARPILLADARELLVIQYDQIKQLLGEESKKI